MPPTPEQVSAFLFRLHLFQGLDEEEIAVAVKYLEPREVEADALVFEQGQQPAEFFFIFSGRLKVTSFSKITREDEMLGFLDEGDFFGQDVFQENRLHQVTVQAVTKATLLVLNLENARALFDQVPDLAPRMRLVIDSHNLMFKVPLPWVHPEEYIYYIAQKHPVFLWVRLLPWIGVGAVMAALMAGLIALPHVLAFELILGLGLAAVAGLLVWNYIDWSNDYCIITGRRIVYQEKVVLLYDSRQESPIEQVQSYDVDSTQMGRIFHYGDVIIRTFTGTIYFRGVRQPQDVYNVIQEMQKRSQSSLRQAELRQIEDTLKQRIGFIPPQPPPPPKPPAAPQNALALRLKKFMADLFHLRYQIGDTIQYRTHWWILVQRVWFQSLLLLGITGVMVWILVRSSQGEMNNFPALAAFMGLCVVWLVIGLSWLYNYIDWHNDIYRITSDQVEDINRKPLGNEIKKIALIRNILSVEYRRLGIIGLMLNFGTVYIRVGETTFTFDDVYNPSEVQRELFHRMSQRNLRDRQAQADAENRRMADWIAVYHRITHRNP